MKTQSCCGPYPHCPSRAGEATATGHRHARPDVNWLPAGGAATGRWLAVCLALAWLNPAQAALPIFENQTPTGFSPQDSTDKTDFVEGTEVNIRVDLNQAATPTYPVIGHFHNLERSVAVESGDVDGMRADIAVGSEGVVHMAWISQEVVAPVSTPAYFVRYARSYDQGRTFTQPVSVSGAMRFDLLTTDGGGPSFSTVDLELDSRGNPRVAYAFNYSPDGNTARFSGHPDNVYFNYSETGGANWLPANKAIVVNDTLTTGTPEGRRAAFPRLAIDQRDNIYITYVRGSSTGGALTTDDVMLASVNRETSPYSMKEVGSLGTVGSSGGVRLTPEGDRQTGPDIAVGTGDILHIVYYNDDGATPTDSDVEHKTLLGDLWDRVDGNGWNQDVDGADIGDFIPTPALNGALNTRVAFYFPTVVVDGQGAPDRVYAFYKYGDATYETVFYNRYVYDNATGGGAGWNPAQAAPVWSTASTPLFASGNQQYNIEMDWTVVDRVSAVVDDRRPDRGEIHIVFTAGYSNTASGTPGEQDVYYGFYNGASWTLPEMVADEDSDGDFTEDGIAAADVYLSAPVIAKRSGDANLYMAFVGGQAEGLGVGGTTDANHHAYFKVLGRAYTSEDESVPVGGYQYDLSYTPTSPHDATADIDDQAVYVHVADNLNGDGLGGRGRRGDGFLAGNWDNVGTSLQDDDKYFEGRINEDATSTNEWGDDNDKVNLLVKLNVLGSDSATNLQIITASTASDGGTGERFARTVRVGSKPPVSLAIGDFFLLGADIDIIDANTAPTIAITQPDGVADTASASFGIRYSLSDPDDDLVPGELRVALYYSPHSDLSTVQDIRIFGTLIADENDAFAGGTGDLGEGANQTYNWDDPPANLKALLFASIFQVRSGDYYVYLVADDRKNPPVFTRSPGILAIRHRPTVVQIDPTGVDTVDTGVRSGAKANPYDLDFYVRDYDRQGSTQVALFYSAVSGLTSASVEVSGTYPDLRFVLGKSLSGVRAVLIEQTVTLTSADTEFSWDVTDSVVVGGDSSIVAEGTYFLYAVASDSSSVVVGQSNGQLLVRHSPSFTFYEPPRDTHRRINTGSQPVYTVQWQKGRGDGDFDDDATIDLYFTSDNPVNVNYEEYPDSLLRDSDTRSIVSGLSENGDGPDDMYVWDFRSPPGEVPTSGQKVWLYAVISDSRQNLTEALGGAITATHTPYINLLSADLDDLANFEKDDVLRVSWDDYLVDDGVGTDDAYIRLYASENPSSFVSLQEIDAAVDGATTFLINSDDGSKAGNVTTIRESDADFYDWNTKLYGSTNTDYDIYAAIGKDETFIDNSAGDLQLSKSSSPLSIKGLLATTPHVALSPTDLAIAIGDTVTFDVTVQYPNPLNLVQVVIEINGTDFTVPDQDTSTSGTQPFLDLGSIFAGTTAIENQFVSGLNHLRFAKSSFVGQLVGSATQPEALARFQLVAREALGSPPSVVFLGGPTGTVLGRVGESDPLSTDNGLSALDPQLTRQPRGRIEGVVELEGRTIPPVSDHKTLLDIHLRLAGSTIDIADTLFVLANDEDGDTADTVEVQVLAGGDFTLTSVPAGRYVLTVKDTSHVSGRTDTITVRNGETVTISAANNNGFFGSDLRGDPTALLPSTGRELIAGDVSEDNEINEDDVNLIIAAWGSDTGKPSFRQADINNDAVVGAADLTVTTSNFGNSQGFGAPPVYKPVVARRDPREELTGQRVRIMTKPQVRGDNLESRLELTPLFDQTRRVRPGETIGLAVAARGLEDLAGYEFDVRFDESRLRLVPERVEVGDVFAANPYGAVFEARSEPGGLRVISSRIGKEWSAAGDGTLATLWFEVLDNDFASALELGEGVLLNPRYQPAEVTWARSLADLLLPRVPGLDQNYPNPFNPSTAIPFALPSAQRVRLDVYNMLGQRVRTLAAGPMEPGFHTIVWNGRDDGGRAVAAGLYISLLETADQQLTRKMLLVK